MRGLIRLKPPSLPAQLQLWAVAGSLASVALAYAGIKASEILDRLTHEIDALRTGAEAAYAADQARWAAKARAERDFDADEPVVLGHVNPEWPDKTDPVSDAELRRAARPLVDMRCIHSDCDLPPLEGRWHCGQHEPAAVIPEAHS